MSGQSGQVAGNSSLQLIEAITQFVNGTQAVWNSITVPVPAGLVVYATDTTVVKMGDGVTLYANLPTLFTISSLVSLTNLINAAVAGNATLTTEYAALSAEYTTLQAAVAQLQIQVSTIAPTSFISESGNITVQSGQYFVGIANNAPAATVVTLPPEPLTNEEHIIKDMNGVAQAYNITIVGNGKTIDGAPSVVIRVNFGSVSLFWNGTSWSQN